MRIRRTSEPIGQYLHLNDRLELFIEGQRFSTRIEGIGRDTAQVAAPIGSAKPLLLQPGALLEVRFHHPDGLYRFDARVMDHQRGTPPLVALGRFTNLRRVQRRSYARVRESVDFALYRTDYGPLLGQTESLGGGGLTFLHADLSGLALHASAYLNLYLTDGGGPIGCQSRVIRLEDMTTFPNGYRVVIAYVDITDPERDRILRHVLKRQAQRAGRRFL